MNWNAEISLGDVITIMAFLFALYSLHIKNLERIIKIETRVNVMWDRLKSRLNIPDETGEHEIYREPPRW